MGYVSDNIHLLSDIAKCIAIQFGENCEVVLHDLTLPYSNTIVEIWNGHVTGRKIGDGGTNAGLKILKGSASPDNEPISTPPEFFMGNIDGLLEEMMNEAVIKTGKAIKDLTKEEKVHIVQSLDERGFFLVKNPPKSWQTFWDCPAKVTTII